MRVVLIPAMVYGLTLMALNKIGGLQVESLALIAYRQRRSDEGYIMNTCIATTNHDLRDSPSPQYIIDTMLLQLAAQDTAVC